jgi:hypothetical protein
MIKIVEREQYRISLDSNKNRLVLETWGDVVEPANFANYADDWKKACSMAKPGFTVLGDYTETGAFFLKEAFSAAMKEILLAGVRKVAVFWGSRILGRWTTEQAAEAASNEYAARRRSFATRAEAEGWLDQT